MSSRRVKRDASFTGHRDRMSLRRDAVVPSVVLSSDAQQVELVDYEGVVERVVGALGDSAEGVELRHLVLFPEDDVTPATEPRERRTLRSAVPELDGADATSLLVREVRPQAARRRRRQRRHRQQCYRLMLPADTTS
ncbi:dedicator of cytokinesis protein 11-like [Lampetra fluviatilis]